MQLIKLTAGVLNQTPLAWQSNKQHILDAIAEAQQQHSHILCLPELCITGYGCEDMFYTAGIAETALNILEEIADACQDIAVSVGLPIRFNNRIYNAACFIADRRIQGFVCKKHLPGTGIYYEPRWFHTWDIGVQAEIKVGKHIYPIGDLIFEIQGVKVGYEICEDAWVAHRPGRELYLRGVDIILNPSASHFEFGKSFVRERFVLDASRAFGCSYVYVNMLGNESGRVIFDGDAFIATNGRGVASGSRFSFQDFMLVSAVVDVEATQLAQAQIKIPTHRNEAQGKIRVDCSFSEILPQAYRYELEIWEKSQYIKEEEFARCIALGLFDYMRKSKSNGWVLSLSGGADSSAIACLCRLAIELCAEEIGLEKLKQKLSYLPEIQTCSTEQEIAKELLTCVYQATENSSDDTRLSAETLAKGLGVGYFEININNLVQQYQHLIEGGIGRGLSWETDDIALQNIQARVRAPSIWLLANIKNALLLATSNRSEVAVGYATMDGDTSGSISPLAGIDKEFIRKWLRWLESEGVNNRIRYEGLFMVNGLQPTAELRPLTTKQTDEQDLMPYDLLNAIENAAIRDKKMPKDVLRMIQHQFDNIYDKEILVRSIERFFRLWSKNQWKRERYAPAFHVDDHNLDPKSWCRFPILSGGFEREIQEMKRQNEEKLLNGKIHRSIGF